MRIVARRGNIVMQVEGGVSLDDPKAPVTLHNELTGEDTPSFYQQALKWGYWEKPGVKMVVKKRG